MILEWLRSDVWWLITKDLRFDQHIVVEHVSKGEFENSLQNQCHFDKSEHLFPQMCFSLRWLEVESASKPPLPAPAEAPPQLSPRR